MNFEPFRLASVCFLISLLPGICGAAGYGLEKVTETDGALQKYFQAETEKVQAGCLADVKSLEDWQAKREQYRNQLFEMLGLWPLPRREELKPVVTGKVEQEMFTVEKLHFQSLPGLYVTANLYVPKGLTNRAPTILYLSGHGPVISNGVSYGNKVAYQHHGAWFARNGYICMTLDTLQLGEIQGLHHGTHREGMWWWNSRGYTPAGVEAWNSIRALDYLETRPEVDASRFGVTGRSGGGAYSWWIAALDDRIKVAAPVAGITDLHNHVVDGVVEGHCDCMFVVNTYRWDYSMVAALVAPRPLMIANSDADTIFPLDGVMRVHSNVKRIYEMHHAASDLTVLITDGPHKDTQALQLPVFRWFNRHLKGEDPLIEMAATKFFTPEQLRVFHELPKDAVNTNIHYAFVPPEKAPEPPRSKGEWERLRDGWLSDLKGKVFRAWPDRAKSPTLTMKSDRESNGLRVREFAFESQPNVALNLRVSEPAAGNATRWVLHVLNGDAEEARSQDAIRKERTAVAVFVPRGLGADAWPGSEKKQVQIRRRFMLLGQTLDGMRVWDVRRAIQAVGNLNKSELPLTLVASGDMAVASLYASLFEPGIERLNLSGVPSSHMNGPDYLNVMRVLDIPQTLAIAAERTKVDVEGHTRETWTWPRRLAENLGWKREQLVIVRPQL